MPTISNVINYFHLGIHQFFEILKDLLGFFYVRIYLMAAFGLNFLNWLFVYTININLSQDLIVLHYNVNFGVNLIGSAKDVYIIPFLGMIIILINLFLLVMSYRQANQPIERMAGDSAKVASGKMIAHLLLAGTLAVNFFLLAGTSSIYLINFFR